VKVTQPVIDVRFVFTGVTTWSGSVRIQTGAGTGRGSRWGGCG
jgi:hypothetical protein